MNNQFEKESDNAYIKTFKFPEEDLQLYSFVEKFLEKLRTIVKL